MPLVTSTEMFKKAYEGGYAIGAFNVNNMEIVQGITEATKEESAPPIVKLAQPKTWRNLLRFALIIWSESFL